MNTDNLCMGCMTDKGHSSVCYNCERDESKSSQASHHLPFRTILNDRYMLGKGIHEDLLGITYMALNLNTGQRVTIKEFMPRGLTMRQPGLASVMAKDVSLHPHFDLAKAEFLQISDQLSKRPRAAGLQNIIGRFAENNTAYRVSEYIDGINLDRYLKKNGGQASFKLVAKILYRVINDLDSLHRDQLSHFAIAPINLIVNKQGIATLVNSSLTLPSIIPHISNPHLHLYPGYAAPELYGDQETAGASADIYATAAVIYRSVCGKIPPDATARLKQDRLESPSRLGKNMPADAEKVLLQALQLDINKRPASLKEFGGIIFESVYSEEMKRYRTAIDAFTTTRCSKCGKASEVLINDLKSGTAVCGYCQNVLTYVPDTPLSMPSKNRADTNANLLAPPIAPPPKSTSVQIPPVEKIRANLGFGSLSFPYPESVDIIKCPHCGAENDIEAADLKKGFPCIKCNGIISSETLANKTKVAAPPIPVPDPEPAPPTQTIEAEQGEPAPIEHPEESIAAAATADDETLLVEPEIEMPVDESAVQATAAPVEESLAAGADETFSVETQLPPSKPIEEVAANIEDDMIVEDDPDIIEGEIIPETAKDLEPLDIDSADTGQVLTDLASQLGADIEDLEVTGDISKLASARPPADKLSEDFEPEVEADPEPETAPFSKSKLPPEDVIFPQNDVDSMEEIFELGSDDIKSPIPEFSEDFEIAEDDATIAALHDPEELPDSAQATASAEGDSSLEELLPELESPSAETQALDLIESGDSLDGIDIDALEALAPDEEQNKRSQPEDVDDIEASFSAQDLKDLSASLDSDETAVETRFPNPMETNFGEIDLQDPLPEEIIPEFTPETETPVIETKTAENGPLFAPTAEKAAEYDDEPEFSFDKKRSVPIWAWIAALLIIGAAVGGYFWYENIQKLEANYALHLQEGNRQYSNGNYESAISSYRQALHIKPEDEYAAQLISKSEMAIQEALQEQAEAERQAFLAQVLLQADSLYKLRKYNDAYPLYNQLAAESVGDTSDHLRSRLSFLDKLFAQRGKRQKVASPSKKPPAPKLKPSWYRNANVRSGDDLVAAIEKAEPGSVLRLPVGIFKIDKQYTLYKSLDIQGAGPNRTLIVASCDTSMLRVENNVKISFSGIGFEHTGKRSADIIKVVNSNIMISNCSFKGARSGKGLSYGGNAVHFVENARGYVQESSFEDNIVGIKVSSNAKPRISRNYLNQNTYGILVNENARPTIADNEIKHNHQTGIVVANDSQPLIEKNKIHRNKVNGISFSNNNFSGTTRSNEIFENGQLGIQLANQARPTLEKNIIRSNKVGGIQFKDRAKGIVRDNEIVANQDEGINISNSAEPNIKANKIHGNQGDGIEVLDRAKPIIDGNEILKNSGDGISVQILKAGGSILNNTCAGNQGYGISLLSSLQPTLLNNKVANNYEGGIRGHEE